MSIDPHTFPEPAPAPAGAGLARLLDGLTRTLLDLPDADPVVVTAPPAVEVQVTPETQPELDLRPEPTEPAAPVAAEPEPIDIPSPRAERRHGNPLNELGFLDD